MINIFSASREIITAANQVIKIRIREKELQAKILETQTAIQTLAVNNDFEGIRDVNRELASLNRQLDRVRVKQSEIAEMLATRLRDLSNAGEAVIENPELFITELQDVYEAEQAALESEGESAEVGAEAEAEAEAEVTVEIKKEKKSIKEEEIAA